MAHRAAFCITVNDTVREKNPTDVSSRRWDTWELCVAVGSRARPRSVCPIDPSQIEAREEESKVSEYASMRWEKEEGWESGSRLQEDGWPGMGDLFIRCASTCASHENAGGAKVLVG